MKVNQTRKRAVGIVAFAMVGLMLTPPVHAESDPYTESPIQFLMNEEARQREARRLQEAQRLAESQAQERRERQRPAQREVKKPVQQPAKAVPQAAAVRPSAGTVKVQSDGQGTAQLRTEETKLESRQTAEPTRAGAVTAGRGSIRYASASGEDSGELLADQPSNPSLGAPAVEECLPALPGQADLAQTANVARQMQKTVAQAAPARTSANTSEADLDDEEYEILKEVHTNSTQYIRQKPQTPAKEEDEPKGASKPFVQKLLKMAKEEANKYCRYNRGQKICGPGSKSLCMQGVRMAFQRAAGEKRIENNWGTVLAKRAGPALKKYGYKKVSISQYNERNLPPVGSVLIYDSPSQPKHAGHIEIRGTDGFYSDFYSTKPITQTRLGARRRLTEVWVPE